MLLQLWSWLMRSSEVITNSLDLFAFVLAAPEIVGRERLGQMHDRLERLRADPRFAYPLIILICLVLVCAVDMGFLLVIWIVLMWPLSLFLPISRAVGQPTSEYISDTLSKYLVSYSTVWNGGGHGFVSEAF
jgi:hypothetical protein